MICWLWTITVQINPCITSNPRSTTKQEVHYDHSYSSTSYKAKKLLNSGKERTLASSQSSSYDIHTLELASSTCFMIF